MKYFLLISILLFTSLNAKANDVFNWKTSISEKKSVKGIFSKIHEINLNINHPEDVFIVAVVKGPKRNYIISKQGASFNSLDNKNAYTIKNQESFFQIYTSDIAFYQQYENVLNDYKLSLDDFLNKKTNLDQSKIFYNYMLENKFYSEVPILMNKVSANEINLSIRILPTNAEGNYKIEVFVFDRGLNLLNHEKLRFLVQENYIYNFFINLARINPFQYTCLGILMAITLGLAAGHIKSIKKK